MRLLDGESGGALPNSDSGQSCGAHDKAPGRKLQRVRSRYAGAIASTRNGLPLPSTILSGAAITTAPVAGS